MKQIMTTMPKKLLPLCILRILEKYTDDKHRILQKDLLGKLESEYGIHCDRKTVQQNISYLKEFGYEIEYDEGYYLSDREFSDSEIRLLIDSVLFSKSISHQQAKTLIGKLKGLASEFFGEKVRHISNLKKMNHTDNKQLFYTLDVIDEAISKRRKIAFYYNKYDTDFKLHHVRKEKYVVSPYQVIANNNKHYVLCSTDGHLNAGHYRLDRITDVEMLDEKAVPKSQVKGMENWNLPKHMAEHIYMFSDESVNIRLKVERKVFAEVVDWFGKDFSILEQNDEEVILSLKCSQMAMFYWALQYGEHVEVLAPESLRDDLYKVSSAIAKKYKK